MLTQWQVWQTDWKNGYSIHHVCIALYHFCMGTKCIQIISNVDIPLNYRYINKPATMCSIKYILATSAPSCALMPTIAGTCSKLPCWRMSFGISGRYNSVLRAKNPPSCVGAHTTLRFVRVPSYPWQQKQTTQRTSLIHNTNTTWQYKVSARPLNMAIFAVFQIVHSRPI